MNNDKGKLYYGVGLDNAQLRADANESKNIIRGIGDTSVSEGARIDSTFRKIGGTIAAVFTVQQAAAFAKSIVQVRGEIESLEISFQTLLGNKQKADALFSEIRTFASNTPMQLNDLAKGAQMLLSFNMEAERVMPTLKQIGDISMGDAQKFNSLTLAFSQMASTGKLMGQDLLQMINAGFNPLTVMAEKTGKSVAQLKNDMAAGAITSEMVADAFAAATAEGGKFYGMLEKQSKGINGSISNLQGTIQDMFNDIGTSNQEFITESIQGATNIVKHYEEIGRVIGVLITSYGTYKAAVIAYAVAQKVAVSAGNIKAFFELAKGIKTAKDAQIALNLAVGANPFVKLASILMAVGGLIWAFSKNTRVATDEITGLNKAQKTAGEEFDKEAAKVKALQDVMNNGKVAYDDRKKALNELKGIIPGYNAQLTEEGALINNNTEAIKAYLVQLERQIKMKAAQDELEEAYRQKRQLEKEYDEKYNTWSAMNTNSAYHDKPIIDVLGAFGGRDIQKAEREKNEAAAKLRENASVIAELNKEIETTGTATGGRASDGISTFAEQLATATQSVEDLGQELAKLRTGETPSANYAKDIADKEQELKDAQGRLNTLLGIDPKRLKADTDEARKYLDEYEKIVLSARERLASEEVQLERDKIKDKLALIEFDRKQTIIAIEQTRDEALKAWVSGGKSAGDFDGSIFQDLINQANIRAEFDTGSETAERIKQKQEELDALLKEFRSYEQQRVAIVEEYDNKIAVLRAAGANEAAEAAEQAKSKALAELSQSMIEESDLWVRLFEDASKKTVSQIEGIIAETQALLDYLQGKNGAVIPVGFSEDDLKSLKGSPEAIKKIQDAIKRLKGEIGSKSPFKQFANDINEAIDRIKAGGKDNIGAGIMNIGAAVNTISPHVKQFGNDLGEIFGDSGIGENIGILTDTLAGLGTTAAGVGQIMTGDVLGGISSIVSGVSSIFSMANDAARRHKEALQAIMEAKIAQQREYNLLLLQQNLLYEQGTTIFGNDSYEAAKNAVDNYKEAIRQLNQELAGTDAQRGKQKMDARFKSIFGMNYANAALKQQYAGLADINIVTGHKKTGLFGWGKGKDTYSSVLDVYPELIKANGDFDKSLAETIISTRKMDDSAKAALQNMIDLTEQYEQAMQEVRDYLTDIFGDLGNTMSNALADAFANGTDAADAFFDSVSDMLENLAKQMIYSVTIAPLMEKAQEQMLATMQNGGLTDEQKFNHYAQILANLTNDALAQQEYANALYQQYQDMAAAKGFDIFGSDASREASSKGIATASQDSVDENNGRLTAIQGHTYSLVEYSRQLVGNTAMILEVVMGIKEDTKHLERLENIEDDMQSVKNTVNDIALKGLKLK